jgi:hypothetical protein
VATPEPHKLVKLVFEIGIEPTVWHGADLGYIPVIPNPVITGYFYIWTKSALNNGFNFWMSSLAKADLISFGCLIWKASSARATVYTPSRRFKQASTNYR